MYHVCMSHYTHIIYQSLIFKLISFVKWLHSISIRWAALAFQTKYPRNPSIPNPIQSKHHSHYRKILYSIAFYFVLDCTSKVTIRQMCVRFNRGERETKKKCFFLALCAGNGCRCWCRGVAWWQLFFFSANDPFNPFQCDTNKCTPHKCRTHAHTRTNTRARMARMFGVV